MKYDNIEAFITEMKKFGAENDAFFKVKDKPLALQIGFEAITDNETVEFYLPMTKLRETKSLSQAEHQIVQRYYEAKKLASKCEDEYIELFTGQKSED